MDLYKPDLDNMKLYVYRRPLHPELFNIYLDKRIDMERYEAQLWLIGTGHIVSFHAGEDSVCELLTSRKDFLPQQGLLDELPTNRAHEYQTCYENNIYYMVSIQAEQMSEAVFESTCEEMRKFAQSRGLFMAFEQWVEDNEPAPFSFIDYEKRPRELDVFTYHAFPEQRIVLKTQSVFSLQPITMDPRAIPENPYEEADG